MRKSLFLIASVAFLLLSSCGDSGISEVKDLVSSANIAAVQWFPGAGSVRKDTVAVIVDHESAEMDTLRNAIGAGETEEYKCGYDGLLRVLSQDGSLDLPFNLRSDCRHFAFVWKDKSYSVPIRESVAKVLESFRPGAIGLKDLSFMLGKWRQEEQAGASFETWALGQNKMEGFACSIAEATGDTVFSEKMSIEMRGSDLYYIADVPQNPAPVAFKLTEISEERAAFENPEHDFPQRIDYILQNGKMQAIISGIVNGKAIRNDLNMTRVE